MDEKLDGVVSMGPPEVSRAKSRAWCGL